MAHSLAIAEFRSHLDFTGNPRQLLQPVARHHTGVIAGATGDDLYSLHPVEYLGGARPETLIQLLAPGGLGESRRQGPRLFVNFLEHVVVVSTQFHHFDRFGNAGAGSLHWLAGTIEYLQLGGRQQHHVPLLQKNKAVRYLPQGQLVRGQEVFSYAHAHHQRTAPARRHDLLGMRGIDSGQGVSALQPSHGGLHGLQQRPTGRQLTM